MSEREKFEKYFKYVYGTPPAGNPVELREEAQQLLELADNIEKYNVQYAAALQAWSEKVNPIFTCNK